MRIPEMFAGLRAGPARKRRTLSAAARRKMSLAQKARWARRTLGIEAATARPKRTMSSDLRNWHTIWVSINHFDLVTGTDFSLMCDSEVKTCPPAREEPLYHVVRLKSHAKFVARQARLRDDHFRRTDRELVANVD